MRIQLKWFFAISFAAFWYVVSLYAFNPSFARIDQAYSDAPWVRFGALLTYAVCTLAAANAYANILYGIRDRRSKRKKQK